MSKLDIGREKVAWGWEGKKKIRSSVSWAEGAAVANGHECERKPHSGGICRTPKYKCVSGRARRQKDTNLEGQKNKENKR